MSILNQYMDKTELAIAGISDAELIKYYIMPDGVMGLLVIKGRLIFNLSSGEKHFDSLEQAALRAYASCPDAVADDMTREILTERSGADIPALYSQYEGIDGTYEKTLPFEKDKVSAFQQMMEYYLEKIYEMLGLAAMFPSELKGYRKKYSLSFRLNNERKIIPFTYEEHGSCCNVFFGNIIEVSDSISLSIKYDFGIITVTADVRCKKHLRIENTFDIIHKTEKLRMFDEAEIVYDGCKDIASLNAEIPGEIKMICGSDGYEILRLPFGNAYLNYSDKKAEIIVLQKNRYDTIAFLYHSKREYLSPEKNIVTDSMTAVHELFYFDAKMKVCTHFLPTGVFSKGICKQKYENRFFYRSFDNIGGNE